MMLVAYLLPVLDNFERALTTIPGDLGMLTWIQGVALIERQLQAILEQQGLQPIDAIGQPFNPQLHEAINEIQTSDHPAGTVVQEYQKGYTMHGRVIRPALVEVAAPPEKREEMPQPEETKEEQAESIADEAETDNVGP
jgi:molecular chaperone GrpE